MSAAFAFLADILPALLAPRLVSVTPLDLQAQSNIPTHWKSLASVFPKHWSSSDRFEHRFLSHLFTSFNKAYLPSAPCLTLPSWDLQSINVYLFFCHSQHPLPALCSLKWSQLLLFSTSVFFWSSAPSAVPHQKICPMNPLSPASWQQLSPHCACHLPYLFCFFFPLCPWPSLQFKKLFP